ncbi:hypothetical protein F0562_013703 [Nyssa sinensis]|uniref:Flavin-containing monooxygenase n=1 Tax=Nyssa sinensis TaxID=561372 RepID=A0A5J4ZPK7_9ASTE|nr:hypothetical protein F0562_013703 [Nyssa sinensis]
MARCLKVAVIGAGVSGLSAARELKMEGHRVVVYEKGDRLGGTWLYDPGAETDPLSLDSDREMVHSSLYLSLRTNHPRHLMGFLDYPFTDRKNGDSRNFPGHEEVIKFGEDFARDYGLTELIRLNTEVVGVERVDESRNEEWKVESRRKGLRSQEVFEAVVVCNGHCTEPRLGKIPGIEKWAGKQVHSHNYRVPQPFRDQIDYVFEDGRVAFEDGYSVRADIIFHCTGYKYHFPFLKTNGIVSIDDNRVGPLYKHVFPPEFGPCLSFVGIPYQVILFHMIELQSKWIAYVLSGKLLLPSKEEMLADVQQHYCHMEEVGIPKHHTHRLYPYEFEYMDWLADKVGLPPVEERLKVIYNQLCEIGRIPGKRFRDEWDIDKWIQEAI